MKVLKVEPNVNDHSDLIFFSENDDYSDANSEEEEGSCDVEYTFRGKILYVVYGGIRYQYSLG